MLDQWNLADGRHFTGQEVAHRTEVAVIGFEVANRLFSSLDPIGKEIRISGFPFVIIGILEKKPRALGSDQNLPIRLTPHGSGVRARTNTQRKGAKTPGRNDRDAGFASWRLCVKQMHLVVPRTLVMESTG